jgi:ATP-binding cassette subfamily B protein
VATPDVVPSADVPAVQLPLKALWRTREYLRPYYGQLVGMLAAALLAAGTEIVIPLLTKAAIDGPIAVAARPGAHHGHGLLVPIGLAAIGLGIAEVVLNLVRRWVQANAVAAMEQSIRDDLYAHLQRLEPGFHDAWQSGQLLSRGTTDLSAIRRFAGFGTIFLITNVATFAVVVTLLIRLNLLLGLLTALVFAPVTTICLRFERKYRVLSRRVQDQQDDLATYVEESAAGIRVLKALGRRDLAGGLHRDRASIVYRTQVAKARLRGTFWASLDLLPNVLIALILLLGALAVSHGGLTTGGLVAFIALVLQLVWPIEAMGYILALGQEAATAAQRVYEILDTRPAITSPLRLAEDRATGLTEVSTPTAAPAVPRPRSGAQQADAQQARAQQARAQQAGGQQAEPWRAGQLTLDHVAFSYPAGSQPVLRDVSLDLRPGETVALVGGTGSGKTTLLYLVARLAEVTSGSIRLDGTDIRELPLPVLRTAVACAFEDPTLFSVSVRENVALGAPGVSDAAIEAALAAAQADFVQDLPWGLDTRIGEQGMSLSGGQRQRIALARAILTSPSVLLLDDPLSALDVHTEAKVTAALSGTLTRSTALVVAHRPSTVALANRVALLDDGEITAVGTHRELLARSTRYRYLMSSGPDSPDGPDSPGSAEPDSTSSGSTTASAGPDADADMSGARR